MALPQHKTTLSVLRSILGPFYGNEARFAEKIGRSRSWLKKASCGEIPLTGEIARVISYETGICRWWLLANNPKARPVDIHGKRYNLKIYAFYQGKDSPRQKYKLCRKRLDLLMNKAKTNNRAGLFVFLLEDFIHIAQKHLKSEEKAA
jgi:hypothetical protein